MSPNSRELGRIQEGEERHYLGAILIRLKAFYELTEAPNIREQVSDEIGWLEEKLGVAE